MVCTIRAGDMTYDRLDDRGLDNGGLGIAKFEDENKAPDKALSRKAAF
jgi:hypothetical protein